MVRKVLAAALVVGSLVPASAAATAPGDLCPGQTFERAFRQFGDMRLYTSIPNGSFEQGLAGWRVSGGAAAVSHANPYRPSPGASALHMPAGSTATSPPVCVTRAYPSARAFIERLGGARGSGLQVEVLYPPRRPGDGRVAKTSGFLRGSRDFGPSRAFSIDRSRIGDGRSLIRFRFTVRGAASYLIDDLLVDPRCRS